MHFSFLGREVRGTIAAMVVLLAALIQSPTLAAPKPGAMESFRDWIVGCDNVRTCTAASLLPEGEATFDNMATLYLTRDGGPDARAAITLRFADAKDAAAAELLIDGAWIATIAVTDSTANIPAERVTDVTRALVRGNRLEVRAGDKVIGNASLSGSAAALRYMDAQQGRAGTITALVAKGALWATAVKAPPRLPTVYRLPVPDGEAQSGGLWREERARALALSGCGAEQTPTSEAVIHPLSKSQQLVLLPCGAGAYNLNSVPLIATGKPGRRRFALPRFDQAPGWGGDPGTPPMLVNASWDAKTATLTSYAKGRGLGDCGSAQSYVWDGSTFRLVTLDMMNECRGAWQWITLWRARAVAMKD